MEQITGRIEDISVRGRDAEILRGPLAGHQGKIIGEIFSPLDRGGQQHHTGMTVQTKIARITLSPQDVAIV